MATLHILLHKDIGFQLHQLAPLSSDNVQPWLERKGVYRSYQLLIYSDKSRMLFATVLQLHCAPQATEITTYHLTHPVLSCCAPLIHKNRAPGVWKSKYKAFIKRVLVQSLLCCSNLWLKVKSEHLFICHRLSPNKCLNVRLLICHCKTWKVLTKRVIPERK